jgi:hypothetical protein
MSDQTQLLRAAAENALRALELPCDRWNGVQSKIVSEAIVGLRDALSAQPAQCDGGTCGLGGYCDQCPKQAQPSKPLFASKTAARKWAELQEQGARMQHIAFDGGSKGPGTIDPWGKVMWGDAAQPAQPAARVAMTEAERTDMACAIAQISTGRSLREVAATAIDWTERHHCIGGITSNGATDASN